MNLPNDLQINAWAEDGNRGVVDPDLKHRLLGLPFPARDRDLPAQQVPWTDWWNPQVGWGVILPENQSLDPGDRSTAVDAPEPIRALVAARDNAPVFRVGPDWQPGTLRRYGAGGRVMDCTLAENKVGTAPGHIPRYLLIVGGPDLIQWEVQYDLHLNYFVGRLDLDETGLENYVQALLSDWEGCAVNKSNTLSWTVDHGGGDITTLMRQTIGDPIFERFANDNFPDLVAGARHIVGSEATHAHLAEAIRERRPSLILTSSHGATDPLNDPAALRRTLGLPVDAEFRALDPGLLSRDAAPGGAIWFAQACCSAGSAARSAYEGILTPGSPAERIIRAVADCGDAMAPLPKHLLGATDPLRAFVGHVEPTFDWSLHNRQTGQYVTSSILDCLHRNLFTGQPIGMALDTVRATGASFRNTRDLAKDRLRDERDETQLGTIFATTLIANDWRSIVLLGDPTCRIY